MDRAFMISTVRSPIPEGKTHDGEKWSCFGSAWLPGGISLTVTKQPPVHFLASVHIHMMYDRGEGQG
jgi:hypothetical protein